MPAGAAAAFKIAAEPPQGPVFLALPMDVLDAEAEMDIAPTTYTNWRARPDAAGLAEVADLLVKARRPMLMVGDSVALSDAQAEVAQVAELLGAPMFECYASEFNVAAGHPLNLGSVDFVSPKSIRSTLADCDVLFVVGAPVFQLIFPDPEAPAIGPQTRLIQLDSFTHELGKNVRPDIALLGDPKSGLAELADLIRERQTGAVAEAALERRKLAEARVAENNASYWANARKNWDAAPITGPRLMHEIKQALPENALVFSESVTNGKHIEMAISPDQPGQLVKVRGGGIGPGLPGALGGGPGAAGSQSCRRGLRWRGDVQHHRALDRGASPDTGDVCDAEQSRVSHFEAEYGRVPGAGGARARIRRHGPRGARSALRPAGRSHGRAGQARRAARRPGARPRRGHAPRGRAIPGRRRAREPRAAGLSRRPLRLARSWLHDEGSDSRFREPSRCAMRKCATSNTSSCLTIAWERAKRCGRRFTRRG